MTHSRILGALIVTAAVTAPWAQAADTGGARSALVETQPDAVIVQNPSAAAPAARFAAPHADAHALHVSVNDPQHAGDIPAYLLRMSADERFVIMVDATKPRLYVFRNVNGRPHYVADYYVTIGRDGAGKTRAGDRRTPLGVYFVTRHIPRAKLTSFYGPGAYPIDYPNALDRRLGHTGYGIWVHGTPSNIQVRPPRASEGCIVLPNPDLVAIEQYLQPGRTPVIIADGIRWEKRAAVLALDTQIEDAIDDWQRDWESGSAERYLAHYATDFRAGRQDLNAWAARKRRIIDRQQQIRVTLADLSVYLYPGNGQLAVATFDQHYESSTRSDVTREQQYWKLENGEWKIVYEGPAS